MKFVIRNRSLYVVLGVTALLVLADSLDALMHGKDAAIFEQFASTNPGISPADYTALVSITLIFSLLIPVSYAVYQFFSRRFGGQASLTRVIWGILLIGALALRLLRLNLSSVFSLISLACLAVLFVHHLLMKSAHDERSHPR